MLFLSFDLGGELPRHGLIVFFFIHNLEIVKSSGLASLHERPNITTFDDYKCTVFL